MRWPWQRKRPERSEHLRTGEWGEGVAEKFLRGKGWRIEGRRVRFGSREELDLVAWQGRTLVFVEVKTRAGEEFGRGWSAVTRDKQRLLSRAAWKFLERMAVKPEYFRFDVVEVVGRIGEEPREIRHLENAFSLQGGLRLPW